MKMDIERTAKFGKTTTAKNLTIDADSYKNHNNSMRTGITSNLSKNLKSRLNLPIKGSSSINMLSSTKASGSFKGQSMKVDRSNNELEHSTNTINNRLSSNQLLKSTTRSKTATKQSKNFSTIKSPTSNIFKSYRCHRYHTDLDFNYLADQKFMKDAVSCGKERLSTVALRSSSPDKYFYENKQTPLNKRRGTNINFDSRDNNNNENEGEGGNLHDQDLFDKQMKNSQNILSDILDSQFSINSPSKMKIYQDEIDQMKNEEFRHKMQSIHNKSDNNLYQSNEFKDKIYVDDDQNTKVTINLSYVGENPYDRYVEALESLMALLDPIFERLTLYERVEKIIENLDDQRRSVRLGAMVALYIILKKYEMDDNYRLLILEKSMQLLQNYESHEELFLVACLEILSLFAPCDVLSENISLICMFLTDFNFPRLQKAAFNCLMSMEYEGIKVY